MTEPVAAAQDLDRELLARIPDRLAHIEGMDRCVALGLVGLGAARTCLLHSARESAWRRPGRSPAQAPNGMEDLDSFAGMNTDNVEGFKAPIASPDQLRTFLEALAPSFGSVTAERVAAGLGDLASEEILD